VCTGKKLLIKLVVAISFTLLASCQVLLATQELYPTDTPTPTLTPTVTIQWFPSTQTPTPAAPRPVVAPTVDQRPAVGAVVLRDDFTDPVQWQTFQSNSGSVTVSKGVLSLAAPEIPVNLVSLRRETVPADFYLEITSSASLCRGKDSYGLVFRADGAGSQYRLMVSCDGYLRVERWRPVEVAVVQNWTLSGQVPPAGLQVLRLGVWMVGSEMRVFVDDVFQFLVSDPLISGQQVGVFLRSTGANAATVNYSNLVIYRIQGYLPSPIPSATPVITIPATRAPTLTLTPSK
jgi:hypothetical protein